MKQHIVSKCYLKAWCDPATPNGQDPYIWLISRDGTKKTKRAPHKSLRKSHAYTITFNDGKQDLRVETTLSQLEGKFVRVQEKIKEEKTLDKWEKAYLAAFMATMHSRTDPFAEGMEQIWTQVDDVVKQMEDVLKKSDRAKLPPPMFPGEGSPISSTDTQYMIRNARAIAVESALQTAGTMEEQIEQQSRIGRIILRSRRTKALAIVDEHRGVHRKQHQVLILEKHEQKRSTRLLERDGNGTSAELSVHTAKPSQTSCDQPR